MQHLIDALNAAQKSAPYWPGISKDIQLIAQYLRSGDERLLPSLHAMPSGHMGPLSRLAEALPRPEKWTVEDRRVVRFSATGTAVLFPQPGQDHQGLGGSGWLLAAAVEHALRKETPAEDHLNSFLEEFSALGIDHSRVVSFAAQFAHPLARNGRLTSAGRFLVSQAPATIARNMRGLRSNYSRDEFFKVWVGQAPAHATAVAEELRKSGEPDAMVDDGWIVLLESNPKGLEPLCASVFGTLQEPVTRFQLGCRLAQFFPGKYDEAVWKIAPAALDAVWPAGSVAIARWMLEQRGAEAVPLLRDFIANSHSGNKFIQEWTIAVLDEAVKAVGAAARPAVLAGVQVDRPALRRASISMLIGFRDPADDENIATLIDAELASSNTEDLISAIPIAASWNCARFAPRLWQLLAHKSKPLRETAVVALAGLGEAAVGKAIELLAARKSETRAAAAALLGRLGTSAAIDALRSALDAEKSDAVSEAIRTALGSATAVAGGSASPPEVSRAAIEASILKAAPKVKFPVDWLDPQKLPALHFADGCPLDADTVRYLLFRQSRCKAIEADVDARPIYNLIDHTSSGNFALAVLNGFFGSGAEAGDRWALAIAGLLGDERVVPLLSRQVQEWANSARGKLAEYAVQALALQASDAALLAVDALAIRYRTKFKNIGKAAADAFGRAAEARGLSSAELGDRVVPWLGFTPGQPRVLSWGESQIEVGIGLDFKPVYRDVAKKKRVAALPGSAPTVAKAEMKELSAALKEAVKAQLLRLENLMVQQHRWPAARWTELFLMHPVLTPFAARLVWAQYDDAGLLTRTVRALEDRTLTTASDEAASPPANGFVGIVHPLELDAALRQAWLQHLADYDIAPPFPQLQRSVVLPTADQRALKIFHDFENIELNAMTFRGRAEKRGWVRGSVVDAGAVPYYYKPFPAAGVDVFLYVEGMYIGIDTDSSITLRTFYFVRHGSVEVGSYTYDEPSKEGDERLIPAGEVRPIAYSEALGDLRQIAGKGPASEA